MSRGIENRPIARRDFLNPFKTINALRSDSSKADNLPNKAVETVGELGCMILLGSLVFRESSDKLATYKVDSEMKVKDVKEGEHIQVLDRFGVVLGEMVGKANNLWSAWKDYEKEKSRIVSSIDEKGNVSFSTEYYTEWEEPPILKNAGLNHYKISDWTRIFGENYQKTANLKVQVPGAFVLSEEASEIFYTEEKVDTGRRHLIALPFYTAVALAYIKYEELAATFSSGVFDDNTRIKRRTLLKLGASLAGYLGIRSLQDAFVGDNENLLNRIKNHTSEVVKQMNAAPVENFRRYFGKTPLEIRAVFVDAGNICNNALNSGYDGSIASRFDSDWGRVKPQIENLAVAAGSSIERFDDFFSYNAATQEYTIPQALTDAIKYVWATGEIRNYVGSQATGVNMQHFLNLLFLAGGLTGAMIAKEVVILPLSDKVLDSIETYSNTRRSS